MQEFLKVLEQDGRRTNSRIASMLGITEEEVAARIADLEKKKVIVGYKTLINWDRTDREVVDAFIELKVTPQRGEGFDKVAERIYKYPQVKTVYLMSGTHDIAVIIEGSSMKEVALFVAEKLAPMESVISTSTSFVLKKYKQDGVI
ncbi:MAG: Lrp/AsnC family transcriptional regulator, partial [Clostridia bacterium]|nr:Lrp/AsnC family transcriptional regulator [Clostridia bacterium]